jgi:hypothetical protein
VTSFTAIRKAQHATRNTRSWLLIAFLSLLFLGPLIAPLFQATGLRFVAESGALAHDLLSRYICPTPAKSYALFGFPMAVCARCWGATIGLWGAWFVCQSQVAGRWSQPHQHQEPRTKNRFSARPWVSAFGSWFFHWPWVLRLCLALGALWLWSLEINLWPTAPLPALIANGANGGFWAGLLAGSLWFAAHPAMTRRADSAQSGSQ